MYQKIENPETEEKEEERGMRNESEEKGLVWKLPQVNSKQLGKLGPAFGIGAGCGLGLGIGLLGGTILFLLLFAHKSVFF